MELKLIELAVLLAIPFIIGFVAYQRIKKKSREEEKHKNDSEV